MKLYDLLQSAASTQASSDGKTWHPARPMTYENTFLVPRIKAAFRVLRGKSDAVEWDDVAHVAVEWGDVAHVAAPKEGEA